MRVNPDSADGRIHSFSAARPGSRSSATRCGGRRPCDRDCFRRDLGRLPAFALQPGTGARLRARHGGANRVGHRTRLARSLGAGRRSARRQCCDEFAGADAGCHGARRHRPVCGAEPTANVHRARWEHDAWMTVAMPVTGVGATGGLRSIEVKFDEIRQHRDLRHILRRSCVPSVVRSTSWFPRHPTPY